MNLPPDIHAQERMSRWSRYLIVVVLAIACLVLVGWQFNIWVLTRMSTPKVGMNPTTAVCFILTFFSFLFLSRKVRSRKTETIGYLLAFLVFGIGFSRFIGIVSGSGFGLDTILYGRKLQEVVSLERPNRISLNTSLGFLLVGLGLLLYYVKTAVRVLPTQVIALLVFLLSLLSILSYMYQSSSFFGVLDYIPMAINTAVCFLLVSLSILFARPSLGIMNQLTSSLSGSSVARVLLPAAVLIPSLFGFFRLWGNWEGLYNNEFGVTMYSMVTMITLGAVVWYTLTALNKRDFRQQRIQQALRNSEQETQAVFQNAPDAIIVIDNEGKIVKWNPQSTILFGYNANEAIGQLLSELVIPEEFRISHQKGMQRYLQTSQSDIIGKTVEIWAVRKDGSPVDVALRISPLTFNNKTYFIGFVRDITEKKIIENKLRNFNQELSKQVEDKIVEIREVFDRVTDGFIALDKDFRYTYANKQIGDLTGRQPEKLIGKNIWEEFPDAVGTETYKAFAKAMETQQFIINTDYFEPLDLWQENHIYPSENGLSVFIRDVSVKKRAEREISKARVLADKLIDSLPGVFYFYDDKGKFIRWNKQFETVTGYTGAEIENMHPTQFFPEDEQEYIAARINGVFEKGTNDAEAHLVSKDGKKIPHFFKATLLEYEGKSCLLGTGIDITERKKAEEQVKLSEQKYKLLFHSNPLPMWMLSLPEYNIIEVNDSALAQYSYSREEFLGLDIFNLRPKEDIEKVKHVTNRNFRGIHNAGIWRHMKKTGEIIYVDIVTHDIYYEGRPVRLVLANEVTEQHLAEEKLKESYESIRKLTDHLNTVREEERLHIAREIHDELGQLLTVLKMDVSWLNKKLDVDANAATKAKLKEILSLIDTTVKTVRRIASELRPSLLDDLGLVAAMEWHLEEFERRSGIRKECELPEEEMPLPDSLKIGMFRILQESLTNVARHSGAKKVDVKMIKKDKQLILTITDDGSGFDDSKNNRKTLGLLGMKERTNVMGGEYQISSKPGFGTSVTVTVPLPDK